MQLHRFLCFFFAVLIPAITFAADFSGLGVSILDGDTILYLQPVTP